MTGYIPPKELADKLSKAKARLILDHPFYGFAICQRQIIFDPATPTASCSAKGTIRVSPEFIKDMPVGQIQFLLAHEATHYLFRHVLRLNGRDPKGWNWACDAVINEQLIDAKVGEFIPDGVRFPGAADLSADEVYKQLPKNGGKGQGQGEPGGIGSDLSHEDGRMDAAEAEAIEAKVMTELVQAAKTAKMQGKLPAGIARLVDEMVNVKTPWYDILERFMVGMVRDEYTWQRPNKRMAHLNLYLPSKGYIPRMGEVVVGVDTSGSIGGPELAEFQAHVNRILEQCRPEKVTVLYCDAHVGSTEEYTVEEFPIQFTKVTGGGGTAFDPVFDWVEQNCEESPDVVVYLTDGYGSTKRDSFDVPTVWLTTGATEFKFGEVVEFKVEDK